MISMGHKYKTRDGRNVRILATDLKYTEFPVVAIIEQSDAEIVLYFTMDGRFLSSRDSNLDLVEVKPRIQRTFWVNVYEDADATGVHASRIIADKFADISRLACIEVTIDCEEDEGLDLDEKINQ